MHPLFPWVVTICRIKIALLMTSQVRLAFMYHVTFVDWIESLLKELMLGHGL